MATIHGRVAATTTTIEGPAIVWQMRHSRVETLTIISVARDGTAYVWADGEFYKFKIEPGPQAQEDQCLC
jgi:hypothetical protein